MTHKPPCWLAAMHMIIMMVPGTTRLSCTDTSNSMHTVRYPCINTAHICAWVVPLNFCTPHFRGRAVTKKTDWAICPGLFSCVCCLWHSWLLQWLLEKGTAVITSMHQALAHKGLSTHCTPFCVHSVLCMVLSRLPNWGEYLYLIVHSPIVPAKLQAPVITASLHVDWRRNHWLNGTAAHALFALSPARGLAVLQLHCCRTGMHV